MAVKVYLNEATKVHSGSQETGSLLNDRVYTWTASDSDIRGLLQYILDAPNRSILLSSVNAPTSSLESRLSDQCPRGLKTIDPVTVGPAMTVSVPEVSFISDTCTRRRRRRSTTATIFSQDNITEITWQANSGRLEAAAETHYSPVGSDVSRLSSSINRSSKETRRESQMPPGSRFGASSTSEFSIQDDSGTQQRGSMAVMTSTNDATRQATGEDEKAEENVSYLNRLRKKSIQIGHTIGSFMNGDYRNADHKPRRESTVVRLRTALDRIEPSRPQQDVAIFGAFTGAQPIGVVDQYHARRPGLPSKTCSEDGRRHRCVQHEVTGTSPG